jgi:hypothetical protein
MMEQPIQSDPDVLEAIYQRFPYLYFLKLQASFIDEAVSLGTLQTEVVLAFLLAYDVEEERPRRDRFAFLAAQENVSLTRYRHIRPVIPWPQPVIGVAWNSEQAEGQVTGTHEAGVPAGGRGSGGEGVVPSRPLTAGSNSRPSQRLGRLEVRHLHGGSEDRGSSGVPVHSRCAVLSSFKSS